MQDSDNKLFEELEKIIKICKNPGLRQQFFHSLIEKTQELQDAYKEQQKKIQRTERNSASFLKGVDRRNVTTNEIISMKDKMLSQQSKMAIMGDMMDSVAHQWKQPLNSLTMLNDMLVDDFKDGNVDESYISDMTETSQMQIAHMVNTLSEFRTFFRPSKDKADFFVKDCLESVKILMKDELIKNDISIDVKIIDNIQIHGLVNEFKHLFLNLLSNSIDALNEKNIKKRNIQIRLSYEENKSIIEFEDNAMGIPQHVIADIFKANVTTKTDGKGTGIGLYMTSQIIHKHNGTISVSNANDGAIFRVVINK